MVSDYEIIVDKDGNFDINSLDYRQDFVYLGSWVFNCAEGATELHKVYTQPEAVEAYKSSGSFPDGTVIIEFQKAPTSAFTTGWIF